MRNLAEQSFYEILELPPDATQEEIDRAFDRALVLYGPNAIAAYTLVDPAEAKRYLELVEEAYLTLSDPELHETYDGKLAREAEERAAAVPAPALPQMPPAPELSQLAFAGMLRPTGGDESAGPPQVAARSAPMVPAAAAARPEPTAPVAELVLEKPAAPKGEEKRGAAEPSSAAASQPRADEEPQRAEPPEQRAAVAAPAPSAPAGEEPEAEAPVVVAVLVSAPNPCELPGATAAAAVIDVDPVVEPAEAPEPVVAGGRAEAEPMREVAARPPEPAKAPRERPSEVAHALTRPTRRPASWDAQGGPKPPPAREEPAPERAAPAPRMPELPPNAVFNGELLRKVREARGLTLRELSDRTRISALHLDNIEADRHDLLPAPVYLRGFLMLVARELKLDPLRVSKSYLELSALGRKSS